MESDSSKQRLIFPIFQLFDRNGDLQPLSKYIQGIIQWSVGHSEIFVPEQVTAWPYNIVYLYEDL